MSFSSPRQRCTTTVVTFYVFRTIMGTLKCNAHLYLCVLPRRGLNLHGPMRLSIAGRKEHRADNANTPAIAELACVTKRFRDPAPALSLNRPLSKFYNPHRTLPW